MRKKKDYSIGANIDSIDIDFEEILSRSVVDCTVNKVIFDTKKIEIPDHWKQVINLINDNNDLNRLLKTDVKLKSKHGRNYAGYDIWNGLPLIWFADVDETNRAVRLNGMQTFAVEVVRTYATINNGAPILRNRIVYTNTTRTVLFQGGFGLNKQEDGTWKDQEGKVYKEKEITPASFPMRFISITTPQYILDSFESGSFYHGMGTIPCFEFLNKDVVDNQIIDRNLNDWYPAKEFIPLIDSYLKYFAWEMNLDHTRVIGLFSNQDIKEVIGGPVDSPQKTLQKLMNQTHIEKATATDNVINQKLTLKSFGGGDSKLDKMQSSLKGAEHIRALGEILDLSFKVCGYSWGTEENAVYENVSQTQNSNKRVYETTKEKIELFTRQWKSLLSSLIYSLFIQMGVAKTLNDVKKEFDDFVNFQIVSNVLQEQNNDWKKTLEIFKSNALSQKTTIKKLYPDMTPDEIEEEIRLIKEEESDKPKPMDQFLNQDNFGSENDKNNNDLADKEPKGAKDE